MSSTIAKILTAQSFLAFFVLIAFSKHVFPFTVDSLTYISTAENLVQGKGLISSNFFVGVPSVDVLPIFLEPPGYSILIAALKTVGVDAYTAGVLIPRVSFLLLPFLFFLVFKRLMTESLAAASAFVSTFMFSVIKCSLIAWSDVPYLALSLASISCIFYIIENDFKVHWAFFLSTGIILGYCFLIRFIGASLIVSIGIGLIGGLFARKKAARNFITSTIMISTGVGLVVIPYFIRNLVVFGKLQAYTMPPSEVSLKSNIHDYMQGLGQMFLPSSVFGMSLLILMVGIALGGIVYTHKKIKIEKRSSIFILILVAYFLLNSAFLIVFKTIYFAPEEISDRYLIQIAWILVGFLIYGCSLFFKKKPEGGYISIASFFLGAFLVLQLLPARDYYFDQRQRIRIKVEIEKTLPFIRSLPADFLIVTNIADITYYLTKRNVRMLGAVTPQNILDQVAPRRNLIVLIAKEGRQINKFLSYGPLWDDPKGYQKILSNDKIDLFIPNQEAYLK